MCGCVIDLTPYQRKRKKRYQTSLPYIRSYTFPFYTSAADCVSLIKQLGYIDLNAVSWISNNRKKQAYI